jgi:molybdopterin adenylyltransferase
MRIRVAVLTVSDAGAEGQRADVSGDTIAEWIAASGYELTAREVVADESDLIAGTLVRWSDCDMADVILTTGGTGFGPRDVTPEATKGVLEREAPGVTEAVRADGRLHVPYSVLSRGLAGTRGRTLIVNLPGSPGAVRDGLTTLAPLIGHVVQLLQDETTDHE